ncbi:hypothetical protein ES703_60981 [subsurface metagenome]
MEMNDVFVGAVKERIQNFNKTRRRRKELNPDIVDDIPLPNRKYGLTINLGDVSMSDITDMVIPRMAGATVRTMLRLKTRPHIITVGMFKHRAVGVETGEYLFRFKIPHN